MRHLYFLLIIAVACLFYACGNKNGNKPANSQQALIVGKWNLQKENSALYIDDVQQPVTTAETSNTSFSYAQFDANNNYISISYYNSGGIGSLSLGNIIAVDTTRGVYSFSESGFSLSGPPALGNLGPVTFVGSSGPIPVIHLISQSAQIMQLTAAALTLHIEYTTTQTIDTSTKTYKNVLDYYYTK